MGVTEVGERGGREGREKADQEIVLKSVDACRILQGMLCAAYCMLYA